MIEFNIGAVVPQIAILRRPSISYDQIMIKLGVWALPYVGR